MDILIAGGGIGGLTTALALHAKGHSVTVYEAAPELKPLGVGINLLPHAVSFLADLGLLDELAKVGVETQELVFFNKFGQRIWREPRGIKAGYPVPQFSLHRGELQMLLLQTVRARLGAARVREGYSYARHTVWPSGRVGAWFETAVGGDQYGPVVADVLIGADGIHSAVRKRFYPNEGPPNWSGAMLWRAAIEDAPFLTGRTMIMAGHENQKLVVYPISQKAFEAGRSLTNWIAEIRIGAPGDPPPSRESWNKPGRFKDFMPAFQNWVFDWLDFPSLAEKTPEALEFPMVDRDPVPAWSFGPVTLLGDAAHPMYPVGSNGASQAILDARTLTEALEHGAGDIHGALIDYEAKRLPVTAALVASNRRQGPEQVMQMVEERAPNGFEQLDDVISQTELEAVSKQYKQVAGFDKAAVARILE